jgi:hypothetical protein
LGLVFDLGCFDGLADDAAQFFIHLAGGVFDIAGAAGTEVMSSFEAFSPKCG